MVQYHEKSKETGIINRFFHILHGEYLLKEKVVVVQTPEWKFRARNSYKCYIKRIIGSKISFQLISPNPIQDGGAERAPSSGFPPVTSANIVISPKNFDIQF